MKPTCLLAALISTAILARPAKAGEEKWIDLLDFAGIAETDCGMLPITGKSWRPIFESAHAGQVMPERDDEFDRYQPTEGDGLYEKFMRGVSVRAGRINPSDFEKQPIKP